MTRRRTLVTVITVSTEMFVSLSALVETMGRCAPAILVLPMDRALLMEPASVSLVGSVLPVIRHAPGGPLTLVRAMVSVTVAVTQKMALARASWVQQAQLVTLFALE